MRCEECDGKTRVVDTRVTYRRRKCLDCGHFFSTYEITQMDLLDVLDEHLPDDIVDKVSPILEDEYPTNTSKRVFFLKEVEP